MENVIIAIGGLPLAGKTTLGRKLEAHTGIDYKDIDDGPARCAWPMANDPYGTEEKAAEERARENVMYEILHATLNAYLRVGRSLIISAVYRTAERRRRLLEAIPVNTRLEFLLCRINDTDEEVLRRLKQRRLWGTAGGCRSLEQYKKLRPSWKDPDFEHHVIDMMQEPDVALAQALHVLKIE